eukprot:g1924.t1
MGYGIPFPVYARAAFGSAGAVGVALSRGVVAIFWCSLQVWLGTKALYSAAVAFDPSIAAASPVVVEGRLNVAELAIFLSFLALHVVLAVAMGPERLRWLFYVAGPVQVIGLAGLLGWALSVANVDQLLAASLNISDAAAAKRGGTGPVGLAWWRGVTAAVSGWSTMVLNIADLSRYSKSQKAQVWGQSLAFPLLNVCTPFVGVLAAGAASLAYGPEAATWDLVDLFQRWPPGWALVGAIAVAFALLTCNLIANVVSPANDIANVAPDRISFRVGAVASLVGVALCQPWSLFATAENFIERFLVGYSMVTGGIFGVMVTDYYLCSNLLLRMQDECEQFFDEDAGNGVTAAEVREPTWDSILKLLKGLARMFTKKGTSLSEISGINARIAQMTYKLGLMTRACDQNPSCAANSSPDAASKAHKLMGTMAKHISQVTESEGFKEAMGSLGDKFPAIKEAESVCNLPGGPGYEDELKGYGLKTLVKR